MTSIKKLIDGNDNQYFPQTHTKAVIDDNGYSVESRMQAVQDVVNQAQMEIGAVPSDLTPTEDSTNWVTSGGVYRDIRSKVYLPVDFTEVGISNMELHNGFSLGETQLVAGNSRSYYRMYLSNFKNPIRKIRVTALGDYAARIAFVRLISTLGSNRVFIFPVGETSAHTITKGTTEDFDVPVDTIMILVNNYSTVDVFPAYIGIMQDVIDGGNLKGYVDAKTMDVNNINSTFLNQTILLTNKDAQEGASVSASITLHGIENGTNYIGYIGFYDSNCTSLGYIGKGSNDTTNTSVTGSINIPVGFSFCKVITSVPDGIDVVLNVANTDDLSNGYVRTYTEHSLESDQSVTNCIIDNSTGAWALNSYQTGRIWKVVEIPSTSKYLKIISKANAAVYCAFLGSWQTPVNGAYPDYAEANTTTHTYLGEYEVQIPSGASFFVLQTHNTTIDVSPVYIGFDDGSTVLGNTLQYNEELEANGREIESVSCPNSSVQVLATDDEDATEYDNANIGYFNVLKINDSTYYMYYSCIGANDSLGDQYQHLAFAYSTDGVNFTRGIPEGITSPVAGTNLIFQSKVIGVQVFKVQDNDYPYRMLASYNRADTRLYKSADGVNFSLVRVVFPYYCDNQVSCIVRGNIVKVYIRWRSDITGESTSAKTYRWIGVFTMDIDGNMICPPTTFFGLNLYQASASILDERREVAFPTFYDFNVDKQYIHCYIIDGINIKRLPFDTTNLIANGELSYYVAPGLVNIGSKMYMYLSCRTTSHNGFNSSNVTRVKRVEVVYDTQGTYWIG